MHQTLDPEWDVKWSRITIIPSTSWIPDFNTMEAEIKEGETWIFLNNEDQILYTFSKDNDEIVSGRFPAITPFDDLIDDIENF